MVKYITRAKHECPLLEAPISLAEGEYHCEAVLALSSRKYHKNPSFPGHAPGKDTLRAANAAMKEGVNGGENGLSEAITRCRPRQ